jgi:two-component system, OmpR family, phosphate regulon sensor histidine kinase PhoR
MFNFWWRPLLYVLGLGFVSFLLSGAGVMWGVSAFIAGLLLFLAHQLRQLQRLHLWLARPAQELPQCEGVWRDVLYRLQKVLHGHMRASERSQADLDRMLQAARLLPDGVVVLDGQNRIAWLNHAAHAHLGLNDARDLGQFVTYLLRNGRFTSWLNQAGDEPLAMESPADPARSLTLQIVPLPRGQKMLLSHDITELMRVDAIRRDFVANVSHELRTPITVIVGFLEAFADMDRPDPEQLKHHLGLMREQSDRIRRLVDDLLTLARLEGDSEVKDEVVDVPALARNLLHEARSLSQERHEIRLELGSGARLRGSQRELHSAMGNLVSNAVRYTPARGHITLRWEDTPSGGAQFSVIDTGDGIEAQHIPRLTERFYRVDRGRSRATGGTGLGLAIVKHVLQRHQGRLKVESTVGKGSTFTAVFPGERVIPGEPSPAPEPGATQAAA